MTGLKKDGLFIKKGYQMEGLDLKQMSAMVKVIADEKNLPEETVLGVIESAIAAAWRKDNGEKEMNVRATLNTKTGTANVYVVRNVVENEKPDFNSVTEIMLKDATKGKNIGDIEEEEHEVKSFGRVASMTAKQVVIQKLREAEREVMLKAYEDKVGTVVNGLISKVDARIVRIDLSGASGIMPKSEQIEGERYVPGNRIKVLIKRVERDEKGAQMILSRSSEDFIVHLFRQEVPELESNTVRIVAIAREAGRRTKIAVASDIPGVDPVGSFVGGRGVRIQAVMNEISDREKIDIINWSDNPSEYIREAISPAEVVKVEINGKNAKVFVNEDQQSVAIGRQGQNVRLASRLTGYELDIEIAKAPAKKPKKDIEEALLSAIDEAEE